MSAREPLAVAVLTFNCEGVIGETLAQARRLCARPFVVDSHSTDRTVEIARAAGCEVVQRPFKNYADQRNWAVAQLEGRAVWQLHLDADEVLDDTAVGEIARIVADPQAPHRAYMLRRIDYFMGRRLRFSGVNPWHLRLFRSGHGACENRLYDQHFVADAPAARLRGCMHDKNAVTLTDWTARHNRWADAEVDEVLNPSDAAIRGGSGNPVAEKRAAREFYYRRPMFLRALMLFIYRYVWKRGFLDGREGMIFYVLQTFWFR